MSSTERQRESERESLFKDRTSKEGEMEADEQGSSPKQK
jgi:hypothetical protein